MNGIPKPIQSGNPLRSVTDPDATDDYDTGQIAAAVVDPDRTRMQIDYIDEALEESIPASDPPSMTPTTRIGPPSAHGDKGRD